MRNNEPLGIRKVDYQHERRQARRDHNITAKAQAHFWFDGKEITQDKVILFAKAMLDQGWEEGAKVGVEKTKARVIESLENGKLKKS